MSQPETLGDNIVLLRKHIDAHDVRRVAARWSGRMAQIGDYDDLLLRAGMSGDAAMGFFDDFAKTFDVNMDGYLWYFHTQEEGVNVGAYFFDTPDRYVKRLPVTLHQLADYASRGRWIYDYPAHEIPKIRKDKVLNWGLLLIGGVALVRYFGLMFW